MANLNDNKKASKKLDAELFDNVVGGSNDTKYVIGEKVVYEIRTKVWGAVTTTEKTGTIIAINGTTYTLQVGSYTVDLEEKDILHVAIEN